MQRCSPLFPGVKNWRSRKANADNPTRVHVFCVEQSPIIMRETSPAGNVFWCTANNLCFVVAVRGKTKTESICNMTTIT